MEITSWLYDQFYYLHLFMLLWPGQLYLISVRKGCGRLLAVVFLTITKLHAYILSSIYFSEGGKHIYILYPIYPIYVKCAISTLGQERAEQKTLNIISMVKMCQTHSVTMTDKDNWIYVTKEISLVKNYIATPSSCTCASR